LTTKPRAKKINFTEKNEIFLKKILLKIATHILTLQYFFQIVFNEIRYYLQTIKRFINYGFFFDGMFNFYK
jgi:hypothetical protein